MGQIRFSASKVSSCCDLETCGLDPQGPFGRFRGGGGLHQIGVGCRSRPFQSVLGLEQKIDDLFDLIGEFPDGTLQFIDPGCSSGIEGLAGLILEMSVDLLLAPVSPPPQAGG